MIRALPLLFLPFLLAFHFSPMSQTVQFGEGQKNGQFLIENDGASSIAVELSVKERIMDENGNETLADTKDVAIFPPQVIIPAKEKRTIRVSFNLKGELQKEKNYRVIAEQLGLKVDKNTKDKTGIQVLMRFVAALYATPSDAKSDVKAMSQTSNGKKLVLVLENQGSRHQLLNNPVLKYIHEGKKGELKSDDLKGLVGENILAGQKRIFTIETSKVIPVGSKLELKFND